MHDEIGRSATMNHAVVIAGAGPTGLMLAAELVLAKVDVAIVERRETQEVAGSRAGGLHARTIEVLDQRGIAERFLSQGRVMQVGGFAMIPLDISDFPTRHNYGLALWQEGIERTLAAWVDELAVPIYRALEVTGFAQDDTGVDVELSDGRSLRAKYLVGCDGGRSLIRKKAGIDFPVWDPSLSYLIAEVAMTEEPAWGIRRDERGINGLGKLEDGKRVRMVLNEPHVRQGDDPTLDDLREALIAVYGTDFGVHNVTWPIWSAIPPRTRDSTLADNVYFVKSAWRPKTSHPVLPTPMIGAWTSTLRASGTTHGQQLRRESIDSSLKLRELRGGLRVRLDERDDVYKVLAPLARASAGLFRSSKLENQKVGRAGKTKLESASIDGARPSDGGVDADILCRELNGRALRART